MPDHRNARQVVNDQMADYQAETERLLVQEMDAAQRIMLLNKLIRDNPIRAYSLALEVMEGS